MFDKFAICGSLFDYTKSDFFRIHLRDVHVDLIDCPRFTASDAISSNACVSMREIRNMCRNSILLFSAPSVPACAYETQEMEGMGDSGHARIMGVLFSHLRSRMLYAINSVT